MHGAARGIRVPGRCRHGAVALRAAGAPGRAVGGRDRWPAAAARRRHRAGARRSPSRRSPSSTSIDALGLPDDLAAQLAIAVLLGFGVVLLVPPLADRVEAAICRIVPAPAAARARRRLRLRPARRRGPRASSTRRAPGRSSRRDHRVGRADLHRRPARRRARLRDRLSASCSTSLMLGGRRLTRRARAARGRVQMALGAVMVVVALLMLADPTCASRTRSPTTCRPSLVNPTHALEQQRRRPRPARRPARRSRAARRTRGGAAGGRGRGAAGPRHRAGFTGTQRWFNTPGDRPLTLAALRGRVVLVDFWTYTCINCIRTLPYLKAWDARTAPTG